MSGAKTRKQGVIPDVDEYEACDYIAALHRVSYTISKRKITVSDYNANRKENYPTSAEINEWAGSWEAALEKASLIRSSSATHYPDHVMEALHKMDSLDQYRLVHDDYQEFAVGSKYPSHGIVSSMMGSWSQAKYSFGVGITMSPSERANKTKEECITALQEVLKGRDTHSHEVYKAEKLPEHPSWFAIVSKFDHEWINAVQEAGVYVEPKNADEIGYGDNWVELSEEIRERDNHECQSCGQTSHEQSRQAALHVHHIAKRQWIEIPEIFNQKENLVTLCDSCHRSLENEPLPVQCDVFNMGLDEIKDKCISTLDDEFVSSISCKL